MSTLSQDIQRSKVAIIVVASTRVGRTWDSIILLTMLGITSLHSCRLFGNVTLPHRQKTSYKLNVFIGAQKVVPFGNIQTQIFQLLMGKVRLLVKDSRVEKINNGMGCWNFLFLGRLLDIN